MFYFPDFEIAAEPYSSLPGGGGGGGVLAGERVGLSLKKKATRSPFEHGFPHASKDPPSGHQYPGWDREFEIRHTTFCLPRILYVYARNAKVCHTTSNQTPRPNGAFSWEGYDSRIPSV